jgi:hypothetical protein
MVWVCVWVLCCGALGVGALSGCQPSESKAARVDLLAPQQVTQGAELEIFGANFGDWDVYKNHVLINGECADVLFWSPSRLVIVVPSAIGVGVRNLDIATADGQRIDGTVSILGPDRPRQPKRCAEVGGPVIIDPDVTDAPDGEEVDQVDPPDQADGEEDFDTPDQRDIPDPGPDTPPTDPYFFVLIQDQGPVFEASPGADIDALVLYKRDGGVFYADQIREYASATGGNPFALDANAILGPPDAFPGYPDDLSFCFSSKGFTSLGGFGGYVIASFPVAIEPGDEMEVLEVGACLTDDGGFMEMEPYMVSISPTSSFSGFWLPIAFAQGPARFAIPQTP